MSAAFPLARRLSALEGVSLEGEADLSYVVEPAMLEAVESALLGGETHYTVRPGMPELRRRIAEDVARAGGPEGDAQGTIDSVLVTSGSSEALFVVLLAFGLRSGAVGLTGGRPCPHAPLFRFMGLHLEPDPRKGRGVVLTYRAWDDPVAEQKRVLDVTAGAEGPDVLDLSDALFKLRTFPPFARDRTLVIGNLDGLAGLAPYRVGFLMGPSRLVARCRPWKQALSICTAAPSQRAALYALSHLRHEAT